MWFRQTASVNTKGFTRQREAQRSCLTQTDGKIASGPDAEVEEQVLVELLQEWDVALAENLLQQQLTGH